MAKKKPVPHAIIVDGKELKPHFEYETYAEVQAIHGTNPDYMNPGILADFIVAGLKAKGPQMTREEVVAARPPVIPAALAIKDAVQDLFYGNTFSVPGEEDEPKTE